MHVDDVPLTSSVNFGTNFFSGRKNALPRLATLQDLFWPGLEAFCHP